METENLQPKKKGGVRKGAARKRIDPSLKKVSVVFYVRAGIRGEFVRIAEEWLEKLEKASNK